MFGIYAIRYSPDVIFAFARFLRYGQHHRSRPDAEIETAHLAGETVPVCSIYDSHDSTRSVRRAPMIDGGLGEPADYALDISVLLLNSVRPGSWVSVRSTPRPCRRPTAASRSVNRSQRPNRA